MQGQGKPRAAMNLTFAAQRAVLLAAKILPDSRSNKHPAADTVRPRGDVSRNDLCPCGSGIKFKRCCRKRK